MRTTCAAWLVRGLAAGLLVVTMAACTEPAPAPAPTAAAATAGTGFPDATGTEGSTHPGLDAFEAAVARTTDASAGSYVAVVHAETPRARVEVRLEGSWNGRDRRLDVISDTGTLRYEIRDGQATVDRGEGPRRVPLDDVPRTPTLGRLRNLSGPSISSPGVVHGRIDPTQVLATPHGSTSGSVDVEVRFEPNGLVTGFDLRGPDGTYTAMVTFEDVVA